LTVANETDSGQSSGLPSEVVDTTVAPTDPAPSPTDAVPLTSATVAIDGPRLIAPRSRPAQ
jgi:hypothetical protein